MKIPDKIAITIASVICVIIFIEAFYTAVFVGNQLVYASIASACLTISLYAIPIIGPIILVAAIWRKKQ